MKLVYNWTCLLIKNYSKVRFAVKDKMQAFAFGMEILLKTNFERKIEMSEKSFKKETFWFDFCSNCFGFFNMSRKMQKQINPTKQYFQLICDLLMYS